MNNLYSIDMADEKRYMVTLSKSEAAVISLLRDIHTFGEVIIVKANGSIRRVNTQETFLIEDILKKYHFEEDKEPEAVVE